MKTLTRNTLWALAALLLITTAFPAFAEPATPEEGVEAIKKLQIESGTITFVEHQVADSITAPDGKITNNLSPRTIVKIVLNPAKGSNINVEIWLPDPAKWNGRFLGLGNGGAAGRINSLSLSGPNNQGTAAATTDMGTAPNPDSGNGNPEVWKDFGYRATHLMTVVSKQVVKAYYGKAPAYSYFRGGSTGGQQSLQEAQRYPEDYDGIVAQVPAHCRTPLHAYFLWNDQILKKCPFNESQEASVMAAGIEYMSSRENPAVAGKAISDPRCTAQDIEAVIALAMKKNPTLTPQHTDALRKLFDGPRHATTGERIFNGIPFGSSLSAAHGHLYLFKWVFGANKNLDEINFGNDIDTYTSALAPYLSAENPDLTPFFNRGGKLIMLSGTADSVVPYHATLDYYERVVEHFGSLDKVKSFYRYFIIPGGNHGLGSPVINNIPDPLAAVIQWREKNVTPDVLLCRQMVNNKAELELPIYPYPAKTVWDSTANKYIPVDGPRGGVERVAKRFRPPATE